LLNEVEATIPVIDEIEPQSNHVVQEEPIKELLTSNETFHYFIQRGDEILSQKLNYFAEDNFFQKNEEQLCDKISPLGDWNYSSNNFMEEENYSLTSFMGQRFLYY